MIQVSFQFRTLLNTFLPAVRLMLLRANLLLSWVLLALELILFSLISSAHSLLTLNCLPQLRKPTHFFFFLSLGNSFQRPLSSLPWPQSDTCICLQIPFVNDDYQASSSSRPLTPDLQTHFSTCLTYPLRFIVNTSKPTRIALFVISP